VITKYIEDIWEGLRPVSKPIFKRVDESHPLDLYLGRDSSGERLLVLLTDVEPPLFPQGQSIKIVKSKRTDGKWSLVFKLLNEDLRKIFSQLCDDIIQSSRECNDSSLGGVFIHNRYLRWKKLLEKGFSDLLDQARLRGLVGELLFLDELIIRFGSEVSIDSWLGPFGEDQDFRFSNRWYEVKTVQSGASKVTISSVEQLDLSSFQGELIVIYLDNASKNEPGAFNLIDLVNEIQKKISHIHVQERFTSILENFGLFLLEEEYAQYYFSIRNTRRFLITDDFPLIKREDLHAGVINAKYEISLNTLSPFELQMSGE
jgi:Putative  PD-(D/E)XK family member, (DUF4420)